MASIVIAAARGCRNTGSRLRRYLLPPAPNFEHGSSKAVNCSSEQGVCVHTHLFLCGLVSLFHLGPRSAGQTPPITCESVRHHAVNIEKDSCFVALHSQNSRGAEGAGQMGPSVGVHLHDDPSENLAVVTTSCQQASVTTWVCLQAVCVCASPLR